MIKKTLSLTILGAFTYLGLVSYSSGTANGGAGNRTGGIGGTGNGACWDSGCHGMPSNNTVVDINIIDPATRMPINLTGYLPSYTYNVQISVINSQLNHYGFQAEVVDLSGNNTGTILPGINQRVVNVNNISIVEQTTPLTTGLITFDWISPSSGNAQANFYVNAMAVDMDGTPNGDESMGHVLSITKDVTSVANVVKDISLITYPNPVSNELKLTLDQTTKGEYTINVFSINGSKLFEDNVQINGAKYETSIQTDKWAPGVYYVQIIKDGIKHITTIVKQ